MNIRISSLWLAIVAMASFAASTAHAASPAAESQFISQVSSAFATRDAAKLLALVYWDRVEPGMKQGIEKQFSNLMKLVPTKIELVAADTTQPYEYSRGGTTYRTNLVVTKQLRLEFKAGNELNTTESRMPLGEKDGRLFITTAVPVP